MQSNLNPTPRLERPTYGRAQKRSYSPGALLYVRKVRVDASGRDPGGAFWGAPLPGRALYWIGDAAGATSFFVEAHGRANAKRLAKLTLPGSEFFK